MICEKIDELYEVVCSESTSIIGPWTSYKWDSVLQNSTASPVFGVCRYKNDSPSIAMSTRVAVIEQHGVEIH